MTTTLDTIRELLTEKTGHSIIDSGDIYGRTYQRNQQIDWDLDKVAQASLRTTEYGAEVSVSIFHHVAALLETNLVCEAFNKLDDGGNWNGEQYGCTAGMSEFLDLIGAEVSDPWNSYNWDNHFDQIVQGYRVTINGEEYALIQIHGGCDVRGGYSSARLFKVQEWEGDYWMDDGCNFAMRRAELEPAGLPPAEGTDPETLLMLDFRSHGERPVAYDEDGNEHDIDPDKLPAGLELVGSANAVEH